MVRVDGGPNREITDRDEAMLFWIGRHGIVTADQVARRFFARRDGSTGTRNAYRRLAILESMDLVRRDKTPFWRAPHVLRITTAGARAGHLAVTPARIVEPELRHALSLVDLMEELLAQNDELIAKTEGDKPVPIWRTEREIRTDRPHDRQTGTRDPGRGRIPDGELTLKTGKTVAIELDLTPKRSKDFERILWRYRQESYDLVWWYVLPGVVPRVTRLVNENRVDDFVDVRAWQPRSESAIPA